MKASRSTLPSIVLVVISMCGCGDGTPEPDSWIRVEQDGTGDFLTISEALAVASPGTRILVGPGVYKEEIVISVPVHLESRTGNENTVIDGEGARRCVHIKSSRTTLAGFRIINGFHENPGAGVLVNEVHAVIRDCVMEANVDGFDGAGLAVRRESAHADVEDCSFIRNHADHNGGGAIAYLGATMNLKRCEFRENTATAFAGALACGEGGVMNVENSLFVGNSSGEVAGAIYFYRAQGQITGNTFYGNRAPKYGTILLHQGAGIEFSRNIVAKEQLGSGLYVLSGTYAGACNLYWDNARNAVEGASLLPDDREADPRFCDPEGGDFQVAFDSPAVNGSPSCPGIVGAFEEGCPSEDPPLDPRS